MSEEKGYWYKTVCVSCKEIVEQEFQQEKRGRPFDTVYCENCIEKMKVFLQELTNKYGWETYLVDTGEAS